MTQVALFSFLCLPCIVLADEQPNIVIILTDDQGYADVSYNPHSPPEVSTPHIDALADSSTICTQGYEWACVFADSGRTDDWAVSATI